MSDNFKHSDLTSLMFKAFYKVYNQMGHGFLEKVYERSMMPELPEYGLKAEYQKNVKVYYDSIEAGDYNADMVVNDLVIEELKAMEDLAPEHEVQLVDYLRATKPEVDLLLNFGPEPHFKRRVFSNAFHT